MITLLAESKTMLPVESEVSQELYDKNKPVFEDTANAIMNNMAQMSLPDLAEKLGISTSLATKAHSLAYNFPHKQTGYRALKAYTGDAYRGFDLKTLSSDAVANADDNLRIISSIYGILKPTDIIKPYRCEFNKCIAPGNKTPIEIFKPKITIEFVKYLKENNIKDVIDLLPGDADKCLDWKIIRAFVSVQKVVFQTVEEGGKLKTPIAKRLKELRGIMARTILENNLKSFKELISFNSEDFIYSPIHSKPLLPVFIATE